MRIVTAFASLSLGLRMENNWDVKDERIAERFKENNQMKKKNRVRETIINSTKS